MGNSRLFLVTLILISSLIILQIDYSWAAFPGNNGKIAFEKDDDIFVMNSDGSDVTNLTNDGSNRRPTTSQLARPG